MSIFFKGTTKKHNVSLLNHSFVDDEKSVEKAVSVLFSDKNAFPNYTLLPQFDHCVFIENQSDRDIAIELTTDRLNYRLKSLHTFEKALEYIDVKIDGVNSCTDKYLIKLLNTLQDSRANFNDGVISICASVIGYDSNTSTATLGVIYSGGKSSFKNRLNKILF